MTGQKLSGIFSAASLLMALLFAGNWAVTRSQAAPADTPPQETEASQSLPEATRETAPRKAESAAPIKPRDPERQALAAAEAMTAGSIFVYDPDAGEMLYCSTGGGEPLHPASITKLCSAWVALQYLAPETVVTAGEELALVQPGSSTAYISRGCRLTVEMLIEGMLLPSGNDAAYVLAAAAGRVIAGDEALTAAEAVDTFVSEMNRAGEELGLQNTHFTNPDGYNDGDHYSCPEDIARIGALALENQIIARYASLQQASVAFESGEWITWYNTNALLDPGSAYYIPTAIGLKTGYTSEAGYCLLAAFQEGEERLIIGIFDAGTKNSRYADAAALLEVWRQNKLPN